MIMPKVRFEKLDIEENLNNLVWYAKPENSKNSPLNFYDFTLRLFPELHGKLKENMTDEEVYKILEKDVKPILKNLYDNSKDIEKYQAVWDTVNDDIMRDLEERLDIKWNNKDIVCRVGLQPVCSRDILGRTYDMNYGSDNDCILSTGIPEDHTFILKNG